MAQAFRALSNSPELCSFVKELEVRVFPLADTGRMDEMHKQVLQTLRHTSNLQSLSWTRKGSLRPEVLDAICVLPRLLRLELNATPGDEWHPEQLTRLPIQLRRLSLLLPDREIVAYSLPQWLTRLDEQNQRSLRNLSIICRNSTVVNSTTLKDISKGLSSVTSLTLHGCAKIRDEDVLHAIKSCGQLTHLSLEGMNISHNFWRDAAKVLPAVKSLRTNHPGRRTPSIKEYYDGLTLLVQSCSDFESFTHYLSGDAERGIHPQVDPDFVTELVKHTGRKLIRFEISGLSMSFSSTQQLCLGCRNIEQLVIPIRSTDMVRFWYSPG